jgi:phosphatidylserine/phosphatidylglycerophosphate/cardiolipin synthase-like enzyme
MMVDTGPKPILFPLGFPEEAKQVYKEERPITAVFDHAAFTVMLFMIEHAESSICMTEFEFVVGDFPDAIEFALKNAAQSGVDVRVLMDDLIDSNEAFVSRLKTAGVDAKLNWAKTAHSKMIVVDDRLVMVGSTNLSTSSLKYNREVNLFFSETSAVNAVRLYCTSRHEDPEKWRNHVAPLAGPTTFYGDGKIDDAMTEVVKAAKEKITAVIYAVNANQDFQDGPVMDFILELGSADTRGVEVNVVLERSDFDESLNSLNETAAAVLKELGINVRFEDLNRITHAKLIVADDAAVVATGNWSYHGFVQNHDVAVRTSDADTVQLLRDYAESLFEASEDIDP